MLCKKNAMETKCSSMKHLKTYFTKIKISREEYSKRKWHSWMQLDCKDGIWIEAVKGHSSEEHLGNHDHQILTQSSSYYIPCNFLLQLRIQIRVSLHLPSDFHIRHALSASSAQLPFFNSSLLTLGPYLRDLNQDATITLFPRTIKTYCSACFSSFALVVKC